VELGVYELETNDDRRRALAVDARKEAGQRLAEVEKNDLLGRSDKQQRTKLRLR
jgi:hypothetical protein